MVQLIHQTSWKPLRHMQQADSINSAIRMRAFDWRFDENNIDQTHLSDELFWLVDPLDGTKEFISGNGEFTVNIALIKQGKPLLGVIYIPYQKYCYVGEIGSGAVIWNEEEDPKIISARTPPFQV